MRSASHTKDHQVARGSSLLEVLIAASLLIIGLAATLSCLSGLAQISADTRRRELALTLASTHMNELVQLPRTHPRRASGSHASRVDRPRS